MPNAERKASDRLITSRERPFPIGWALAEFLDGSVELDVQNVVPGEPITVRWRVVLGLGGFEGNFFSLRLNIDGQFVHERLNVPVGQATVGPVLTIGGTEVGAPPQAGWQNETVILPTHLARIIYRIPDNQFSKRATLTAEVRTEVSSSRSFAGLVRFRVTREPVAANWWEWRVPTYERVDWKTGFGLLGDFLNRSRFASVQLLTAELAEVRSDEDPYINPCGSPSPVEIQNRSAIASQGRASFRFDRLHDWGWLSDGTYHIYGPFDKTFNYAVTLKLTDEFGNNYETCSAMITRKIKISDIKLAAAGTALGAVTNALILAAAAAALAISVVGAPGAATLFAAAAVSYGVAAAAGAIAKDPPRPDPHYQEVVQVIPLPLPEWPNMPATDSLTALRKLLDAASHLLALENGRTLTRARLMGARLAGDEASVESQRDGYLRLEREMINVTEKLQQILPNVQQAVEEDSRFDPSQLERSVDALSQGGLSEAMHKAMADAKLGSTDIHDLATLSRFPRIAELARGNGLFLVPFVVSLQRLVAAVRGEREMVLAGETYVHVPNRSKRIDEMPLTHLDETRPGPDGHQRFGRPA
jgi:hypothetical protein